MRRMIPQKLINAIKALLPFSNKVSYVGDQVKIEADVEVEGTISGDKVVEAGDTELIDLSSYIDSDLQKSNTLYAKALVKHGMLHIVVSGNFVAKDLSSANNRFILKSFIEALPESVRTKLFREDGTNITESPSSGAFKVCTCAGSRIYGSTQVVQLFVLISNQAGDLSVQARPLPSIAEDTQVYIDVRFALTL